jgi:hypothetical protein
MILFVILIKPVFPADLADLAEARKCRKPLFLRLLLVPVERIELPTFGLQNRCSTAELNRLTDGRDRRDRRPNKSVA